jgi:hypothetical protein
MKKNKKREVSVFLFFGKKRNHVYPPHEKHRNEKKMNNDTKKTIKSSLSVQEIKRKYPGRVPIHVTSTSPELPLDKAKYLVPATQTFGQFMFVLRKRIPTLGPEEALCLFVNGTLPAGSQLISMYAKSLGEEEMLRCELCKENTFG